ncbi:unnamed protein product [Cuscuta campestris]|uniref:Integrase catalytic domain-containing protein n=1 Tax=Cuscuta campestris TaxID=132261 RepID=A0A484K7T5_9ASTE|nr:unnamed protein product [Cuscuta campestris]
MQSTRAYSVGALVGTGRELALSLLPHMETYAVSGGSKYCEYYRNNTHKTKECFTLQKEMQRLIARGPTPRDELDDKAQGYLVGFIHKGRTWRKSTEPVAMTWTTKPKDTWWGSSTGGISAETLSLKRRNGNTRPSSPKSTRHRCPSSGEESRSNSRRKTFPTRRAPIEMPWSCRDLWPVRTPLSGFTRDSIEAEGVITVQVIVGDGEHKAKLKMEFMVVSINCAHNMILGRPGLEDLECVISPGIGVARGDRRLACSCYVRITKKLSRDETLVVHAQEEMRKQEMRPKAEPAEEVEEVQLDPQIPEQKVKIGGSLTGNLRKHLVAVLTTFGAIFKWGPEDLPGVDPKVICHRLAVNPESRPVRQKKRFLSKYHQIRMHPEDEEKLFAPVLGRSMEAYVDDMIVKSKKATTHAKNFEGVFKIMERFNLRLNPKKCTFGVQGGKFLGHMVSWGSIEPNPEKVLAILDMEAPRNVKEVQRLTGKLAVLSRFLSKVADRAAPFFQAMKKARGFVWTQQSFESLKSYLFSPLVLAKPEVGETLFLYLGVSPKALRSFLVQEEGGAQHPVYYTAKTLRGSSVPEKTVLVVVSTVQRLTPYFQAPPVQVLSQQPIGALLRSPNAPFRMSKWAVFLGSFQIQFKPRPAIKGQAMADFVVECIAREEPSSEPPEVDWGVDLVGALPGGTGNVRYVIVAIDYFTKWVEATPLASITGAQCQKFLAKQVICRFDIPEHVITDNGTQFESKPFNSFLESWRIKQSYASVGYSQTNGQVENANRTIINGLKRKLEACGGEWAEELPYILWTYQTTPRKATRETPFALCYGFEVRAPAEISVATHREEIFDPERNEEALEAELHLVHERREAAFIRAENYQRKVKGYHDGWVRTRGFVEGDWVLRKRTVSRLPLEGGKFAKNYEGPYIIREVVGPSTFRLKTPAEETHNMER